jgi:uncharacterized protein
MMQARPPKAFHIMTKPSGPICNLDCKYCFYLEKENLYPDQHQWRMADDVLENYVRQFIASQEVPVVSFAWQGGEPTLLGVDFFRRAVEYQKKHAEGKRIENSLQTNGVLLDGEWASFLAENRFLVGVSIDGPRELHDHYRVDKGGHPTFDKVMRGIDLLRQYQVEFNTLTVVQRHNSYYPVEVYRFLKQVGSRFMQFIPIVERVASSPTAEGLILISPASDQQAQVSEWSVEPEQFGRFLCGVFDEWVRKDVGEYFVQAFDVALEAWYGMEPSLCVFRRTCGQAMAMEHNGDLYSCDHYVYPENLLGNIMRDNLVEMAGSDKQLRFGNDKLDTLPRYCRECDVRFACNGECPKHRFLQTPDGEPGLNYLCAGYKIFFHHIGPYMKFMAAELEAERPPANVMDWIRSRGNKTELRTAPGRNDTCPCGSGRKFKRCCGS